MIKGKAFKIIVIEKLRQENFGDCLCCMLKGWKKRKENISQEERRYNIYKEQEGEGWLRSIVSNVRGKRNTCILPYMFPQTIKTF